MALPLLPRQLTTGSKQVNRTFVQRFKMCAIVVSKALRLAYVNEGSQFYLPPARLSTYGKSHPAFTSQLQSITALWSVLISRPA